MEGKWIECRSKKEKMTYYLNEITNEAVWKVECPEDGWARKPLDNHNPSLDWRYFNVKTNMAFNSKAEFTNYINSLNSTTVTAPLVFYWRVIYRIASLNAESFTNSTPASRKREAPEEDQFFSLSMNTLHSSSTGNKVVDNYNKEDKTLEERNQSRTLHLRKLDNWIKVTLISEYCKAGSRVLDLACGKGGDLQKWKEQHILHYVGIDIADGSISDAVTRFTKMSNPGFPARFAVANLGEADLTEFLEQVCVAMGVYRRENCLI